MAWSKRPGELRWKRLSYMAIWLWIYDNEFALCNWNIVQPRIKSNFSFFRRVVFFHGERSSNYTMQIDAIYHSCIQMKLYDTQEAGVEFSWWE